ncbi:phosphoenolpyruvate carboxykinase (ATP) [Bacteriovorax stolpii]|uniref:Phosphoenolpyruvate carboxykinase (ATP) n=1 Tax=Bacteriovorax stolpii TaxID=960 RepID=A0A2K9NUA5_BACTC|nr:phosphoenolpyruvate carboxykinase (ATP) [Bacteriovorax stolpii]AUN99099.1 phosphoenolpyruvate carboxykinase (ATP) [Bacteriovorax stolpii]QDK40919.1 phosphoenolpyruvate carboxykinase (ATP) [Bacteriovorax stolpii]TDP55371.1 phosphoenolpyruvate carboxykinase (ATP) [Bacteriovorax stolpii]
MVKLDFTPKKLLKNSHKSLLIEKALKRNEGHLGPNGEFVITTGDHTGRAANDKYVVLNELSENNIWWENNIKKMDQEVFEALEREVLSALNNAEEVFSTDRSIGSLSHFSLGIEFFSTEASSALFTLYMFKPFAGKGKHNDTYKILHAPHLKVDPKKYNLRSETVIVTCFKKKTTLIIGTQYSGEIKKSMFSTMNYLLPDHDILPMHSGANQNVAGESSVFFGLSGTGKTTLSTDEGLLLIGDDEHGMSDRGIFNFEGGCYAKTYKLSPSTEPEIFNASTQFSSYLENVKLSDDREQIDFFDDSITENGRSSYPLSFIKNRVVDGVGKLPKNIFYLSADAFGVLPPVSLLTSEQVMDFFQLGYSAKLAGTEVGVKVPEATFSACFGAPFMLRRPEVYANLLGNMMAKHDIKVWLINTGWYGGSYGTGTRFPLKTTRTIIRAIQAGELANAQFVKDEYFDLKIPVTVNGVETSILSPANAWSDKEAYKTTAKKLAEGFKTQLLKLRGDCSL